MTRGASALQTLGPFRRFPKATSIIIVVFVSLVTARMMYTIHDASGFLSEVAFGVIERRPAWRAYANRLLGPYTVLLISKLGMSFDRALQLFGVIAVCTQNLVLYRLLLDRLGGRRRDALAHLVLFLFMLLVIQHRFWYVWDYIDLIVFSLFAWGIFSRRGVGFFVLLFLVELANRESALFIALFILLDAFHFSHVPGFRWPYVRIRLEKAWNLVIGAGLLGAGMLYTEWIRDLLFIESSLPGIGEDMGHSNFGNHIQVLVNFQAFIKSFGSLDVVISLFQLAVPCYLVANLPKFNDAGFKASLMLLVMLSSVVLFGWILETRVFLTVLPFLVFIHIDLYETNRERDTVAQAAHG